MANIPLKCLDEIHAQALEVIRMIERIRPYKITANDSWELFNDLAAAGEYIALEARKGFKVIDTWKMEGLIE